MFLNKPVVIIDILKNKRYMITFVPTLVIEFFFAFLYL